MALKLYYLKISPPVQAVLLTAKSLNLDFDLQPLDLMRGENLSPEYKKVNPMHTVPTIDDNGFILFDSHAICGYLVGKYGKTDALYPREAKARATVDQRLHFDSGILFPRIRAIGYPIMMGQTNIISEEKKDAAREAYYFLDKLIGDNQWVAGNQMTIADFSCAPAIRSLEFMVPGMEEYPKITAWMSRCKAEVPGFKQITEEGSGEFKQFFTSRLA